MKIAIKFLQVLAILLANKSALADYYATEEIKAQHCRGFMIKVCSFKVVTAMELGRRRIAIPRHFESVDSYKTVGGRGICHVYVGSNLWGAGESGELEMFPAEYIVFNCAQR